MKTETGWIAMTTRRPSYEDLPVWGFSDKAVWLNVHSVANLGTATHWMPAKMPAPPPEPDQRDLDESAAHEEWLSESVAGDTDKRGWHEKGALWAFKTERAAILALTSEHGHPGASCTATLERIRERCAP